MSSASRDTFQASRGQTSSCSWHLQRTCPHLCTADRTYSPAGTGLQVAAVAKLAAVVVATFAACWAPYLTSTAAALEVLQVGTCRSVLHTMHTVGLEDPSSLCMMLHRWKGWLLHTQSEHATRGPVLHTLTQQLPTGVLACHVDVG
jgi:hypothetical protein